MIDNKTIREYIILNASLPCEPGELTYIEAETVPGNTSISFTTNVVGDIKDLHVDIVPKQSGSGDPSPDNVRPITGTDLLKFGYGPIPATGPIDVIDIPLSETVYAGFYDEETEELWKTSEVIDLGSLSWIYTNNVFRGTLPNGVILSSTQQNIIDFLCECYLVKGSGNSSKWSSDNLVCWHGTGSSCYIYVNDTAYNDADVFKTAVTGQKLVYELAAPVKVADITPVEIKTLKGKQKMQSTNKFSFSLKYPYMIGGACNNVMKYLPFFYDFKGRRKDL